MPQVINNYFHLKSYKKMYTSLHICQKYIRLIDDHEETEDIPAVSSEFTDLFKTTSNSIHPEQRPIEKYAMLNNKRLCYRNFNNISKACFSTAMMYHRQAEDCILSDNSVTNIAQFHKYIIDLLTIYRFTKIHTALMRNSMNNSDDPNFLVYKGSILKFTELPLHAQQKLTAGLLNRQQDSAIKGYFHLMLDVQWLFISISVIWNEPHICSVEEKTLEIIDLMQDIHFVIYKCYEKTQNFSNLCTCLKVFWLRLQLLCEENNINFWVAFNTSMDCYDEEFVLLNMNFLANLQCYSRAGTYIGVHCHRVQENVEFFNKNWNQMIKNTSGNEDRKIYRVLMNIEGLLTDCWLPQGKLEFYYQTWDFFNKKIEGIEEKRSFHEIMTLINHKPDQLQQKEVYNREMLSNGFIIFLRMLKKHLERHPKHWNKFKGRIFTKFPPVKFQKLSEQGLHNLAVVFFSLQNVNFEETSQKLLGLLKDLPGCKQSTKTVWSVFIYMIKQHLEKQLSITPVHTIFGPLLEESSRNRNNFNLVTLFTHELSSFFRVDDLTLKQSSLISCWLENYIKSCSHNDLISLLNTLSMIIDRTVVAGAWYEYQNAFITHVLQPLKRLSVNHPIIGTVSGLIIANTEGLDDVAEYFASEVVPGEVMMSFYMTLRRKSTFTSNEKREFLSLKAWFLSVFIGIENQAFTADILQLLKVRKGSFDGLDATEDVFQKFLEIVDRETLLGCLKDSEKFFAKNLNLNVFTNMALLFHIGGNKLYIRTASTCYLSMFIDQFLLPMDVLRGTKPPFLSLVEKTWHLFMFSLWKLNCEDNDPYLERLIKDLTLRYLPHFCSKPTVLLKIANNKSLCDFVFQKISLEFFAQNKSKLIGDECLFKALNSVNCVLDDFLFEGGSKNEFVEVFASRFLASLFEVYMFKNHKVIVVEIIKKLARLRGEMCGVRKVFAEGLVEVMKKHLAFSTNQFFQMCYVLVKIAGDVVKGILGRIKEEIAIVERKRAQGFDNHLRQSYDKLVKLC